MRKKIIKTTIILLIIFFLTFFIYKNSQKYRTFRLKGGVKVKIYSPTKKYLQILRSYKKDREKNEYYYQPNELKQFSFKIISQEELNILLGGIQIDSNSQEICTVENYKIDDITFQKLECEILHTNDSENTVQSISTKVHCLLPINGTVNYFAFFIEHTQEQYQNTCFEIQNEGLEFKIKP